MFLAIVYIYGIKILIVKHITKFYKTKKEAIYTF